jgi:DNA-binding FadR family transcriptional regulator
MHFYAESHIAQRLFTIKSPHKPAESPRNLRIHQSIARQMGIAIVSGEVAQGALLGGEIEQAEALGVSRTAYREAIRILTAKGLLASRPRAGTHVTPRKQWNLLDPEMLAWAFASAQPDEGFIRDLFELRGIIEPAAAALAATRRSAAQLADMQSALDDMRLYGLASEAGQAADRLFHDRLLAASGNEALASLAGSVGAAVQWTTAFKQRISVAPRDPLPEHEAVLRTVIAGDANAAAAAMRHLLELAREDMRG